MAEKSNKQNGGKQQSGAKSKTTAAKSAWGTPVADPELNTLEAILEMDPHTASSDAKGHNNHIGLRVPPDISRQIAEQVESGLTPYKTQSDWVRDAIGVFLVISRLRYFKDTAIAAVWSRRQKLWQVASKAQQRTLVFAEAEAFADSIRQLVNQEDEAGATEALASLAEVLAEEEDHVITQYSKALRDCPQVVRLVENIDGKAAKFLWQVLGRTGAIKQRAAAAEQNTGT
jgi:Arc/MetJ-type ribon-helix-helix transcriptional regulator